ncbi:MAG: LacI family transcriptional regulator [Pseudonocardia sp.]|nr:LacI family transcriptional regulator [Pseudonocardia sp.]
MDEPQVRAGRARQATIVDVAALAGVSPATVSRSLRGHSNVSAGARQRVLDAARELAYTVSPHASGLASGRTGAVGVVVPFVTRWFFANVIAGLHDALSVAGYDLLLYHLDDGAARDRFFERMPLARRVDAVVSVAMPLSEDHTRALRALGMPMITVGARVPEVPGVGIDDRLACRTAVHHLLHQGHERIVLLAGLSDDRGFGFVSSHRRRAGYLEAMAAAGLSPCVHQVVDFGIEAGATAMAEILGRERLPTAVVAEYDELAIGAIWAMRRASVAVPGQVSIVGMDDHEMATVVDLTTVAQPVRVQGAEAGRLLAVRLAGGEVAGETVLPTRLIVRGSTGVPIDRAVDYAT